jgi:hypothetical protein
MYPPFVDSPFLELAHMVSQIDEWHLLRPSDDHKAMIVSREPALVLSCRVYSGWGCKHVEGLRISFCLRLLSLEPCVMYCTGDNSCGGQSSSFTQP